MKIIIAPDSFKGALRSPGVCEALQAGWLSRRSQDEVLLFPLADGGEGTCEALVNSTQGRTLALAACDPLMRRISVSCGIAGKGNTGIMELAAASGIELLAKERYVVLQAVKIIRHLAVCGTNEIGVCVLIERALRREHIFAIMWQAEIANPFEGFSEFLFLVIQIAGGREHLRNLILDSVANVAGRFELFDAFDALVRDIARKDVACFDFLFKRFEMAFEHQRETQAVLHREHLQV